MNRNPTSSNGPLNRIGIPAWVTTDRSPVPKWLQHDIHDITGVWSSGRGWQSSQFSRMGLGLFVSEGWICLVLQLVELVALDLFN